MIGHAFLLLCLSFGPRRPRIHPGLGKGGGDHTPQRPATAHSSHGPTTATLLPSGAGRQEGLDPPEGPINANLNRQIPVGSGCGNGLADCMKYLYLLELSQRDIGLPGTEGCPPDVLAVVIHNGAKPWNALPLASSRCWARPRRPAGSSTDGGLML